jgi:small subunit ribosomal protein S14
MTTSSYTKMFKQLKSKPAKLAKYKKHNSPKVRSCGKNLKKCRRCGSKSGHIQRYQLKLCRKCFRDIATSIGFRKYS